LKIWLRCDMVHGWGPGRCCDGMFAAHDGATGVAHCVPVCALRRSQQEPSGGAPTSRCVMHVNFRVEEKCEVSEGGAVASEDWAVVGLGVAARVEGCDLGPIWIFRKATWRWAFRTKGRVHDCWPRASHWATHALCRLLAKCFMWLLTGRVPGCQRQCVR
jgi:hypothetical protein